MRRLVFIHGLNTYGDDDLHIGPLKFGLMHARLEAALRPMVDRFTPLTGFGSGSPEEQAKRITEIICSSDWYSRTTAIDWLGQSVGGLTARVLAQHPEFIKKTRSILTFGTPHHGAPVAELALSFENRHRFLHQLFSVFGYDTGKKNAIFQHYTAAAMRDFNRRYARPASVRCFSLICDVHRGQLSLPLRLAYGKIHGAPSQTVALRSDGLIFCDSQAWGETRGPFALDHFAQLGFFPYLGRSARWKAETEFHRFARTIAALVSDGDT